MPDIPQQDLKARFFENGFLTGLPAISADEAAEHRAELEAAEARYGRSMHYVLFPNLIFESPDRLARDPRILDRVEALIGPDILTYEMAFVIKEPGNPKHVTWHQDLTYWGLDTDEMVTVWLALSPATPRSGCMRMIPGSHKGGRVDHHDSDDPDNILARGQHIDGVDEDRAVDTALAPGEMSIHHGWTMHASHPNRSDDRRIGLTIVYIAPRVRQTVQKTRECAMRVRGEDRCGHYDPLPQPSGPFDPDAMTARTEIDRRRNETWQTG